MKFKVERNFLVRTEEIIDLNPKDYLYCANFDELLDAIEEDISDMCEHPKHPNLMYSEELGNRNNLTWNDEESFFEKWQELKGLPQEL